MVYYKSIFSIFSMEDQFTFTIIRHGQTQGNSINRYLGVTDEGLNERGIQQAEMTARFLKNIHNSFDLCLCSPLKRCTQTADMLQSILHFSYLIEPKLRERNYGIFEGLTHKEVNEKYPLKLKEYRQNKVAMILPEGESALDVESRIRSLIRNDLSEKYSTSRSILFITHLNPLRAFLHLLGLKSLEIYHTPLKNASITQIRTDLSSSELVLFDLSPAISSS